jgi:hypothetical protein
VPGLAKLTYIQQQDLVFFGVALLVPCFLTCLLVPPPPPPHTHTHPHLFTARPDNSPLTLSGGAGSQGLLAQQWSPQTRRCCGRMAATSSRQLLSWALSGP